MSNTAKDLALHISYVPLEQLCVVCPAVISCPDHSLGFNFLLGWEIGHILPQAAIASMRVLPVLAVCLVQLGLVQSQAITCTSNQPDTNCTASNSCEAEHPPEGSRYEQYIDDTCDPGFSSRTYSLPIALESQFCPNFVSCEVAADNEESTRYEGRPEVNVRLETASLYRFDMHISWEHNPVTPSEQRKGYQVQIHSESDTIDCFCVNNRNARNLTVTGLYMLRFGNRRLLIVEVAPYPLPFGKSGDFLTNITGQYSSKWPMSCLDLGRHNCFPSTYPAPSNIQLDTYNETIQSMRLDIMWDTVTPYSSWNNSRDKFTYYLQLVHREPDFRGVMVQKNDHFKITSTGNSSGLMVSLFPLNISVNDTYYIYLLTHYPCSGLATVQTRNIGCGNPSTRYSIPTPLLPRNFTVSSVSSTSLADSFPTSTVLIELASSVFSSDSSSAVRIKLARMALILPVVTRMALTAI